MMKLAVLALAATDVAALAMAGHASKMCNSRISKVQMMGGKGFGGGEATRDPEPTSYDPSDPKGKQQAIHKAESFADYLARRSGAAPAPAPAAPAYSPPAAPAPMAYSAPPAYAPPAAPAPAPVAAHGGKGFGGGEATRDPEPTAYDPNDPKGKQQAIHKAESFADYLARRSGA
eukprot:CAMPEP_0119300556 /NCGR_PEP_ID=MMETSP1333-20130426/2480_1 /TAXON_ID=418940 /ORGANISM="Scyphosphaera apsteinii, Strain RCC1455" /LENGTH=173 /DNA_ID=CAMNT_0007302371 /DNA_START=60 /DNA_END=581 /DNA_ORIENTATION=-